MSPLFFVLLVIAVAVAAGLLFLARWRPERVALVLGVLVVGIGVVATGVDVVDGISDSRVEYRGKLDAAAIVRTFNPGQPYPPPATAYLSKADGEVTLTQPDAAATALWALSELAPWLLAAAVLTLLAPLLLAADRGDPFREDAPSRLATIGALLLIGIPALAVLAFIAATAADAGSGLAPTAEATLRFTPAQLLPGVLVLVLAGIFRRGFELQDLERHTV